MKPSPLACFKTATRCRALASVCACVLAAYSLLPTHAAAQVEVSSANVRSTVDRLVAASDAPLKRVELGLACLEHFANTPNPKLEKDTRLALGIALSALERLSEASEHLRLASALATKEEDPRTLAHASWLEAVAAFHLGRLEDAVTVADRGLEAAVQAGWDGAGWRIANMKGLAYERRGDSGAALSAFKKGQEFAEREAKETGNKEGLSVLIGNIGIAYMNLGELELALEMFERDHELVVEMENQPGLASALANIGDVLILLDQLEDAYDYHEQAYSLRLAGDSEVELARSHYSIGSIHLALEEYEEALAKFEQALEIRQRLDLKPDLAATLAAMAQTYAALDREEEALTLARDGVRLVDELELAGRRHAILASLGSVYASLEDHENALDAYREAHEVERRQRSLETRRSLAEFRAEYEAREREQEIELLSRERELQAMALNKRQSERNALLVGAGFLGIVALAGWLAWASLSRATKRIRRLEEDRIRADRLESIGVLAGGIAHDFNNVLAAVVGNLSVLRLGNSPRDLDREIMADVDDALSQGRLLASQLLALAKGGVLTRELRDMKPLIRESTHLALSGSACRGELDVDPELWCADVDSGQMRQVLSNIIINADQAMPEGGTIQVKAQNVQLDDNNAEGLIGGPYVRISVLDQGPGIPESIKDKIFDPYVTTKAEGSGLGLALAFAIVRRHGGSIQAGANPQGGSRFIVTIPANPDVAYTPVPKKETVRHGEGRILVMDDDPTLLKLYERALRGLGYESESVTRGEAAIDAFRNARTEGRAYEVVIIDLTIPGGMGGRETIRELLEIDPSVKAIVASGYSDDPVLEDCASYGFVAALQKPFTVAALSRAVSQAHSGQRPHEVS